MRIVLCLAVLLVASCGDHGLQVGYVDNRSGMDVTLRITNDSKAEVIWKLVRSGRHGYLSFAPAGSGTYDAFTTDCRPLGSSAWNDPSLAGVVIDSSLVVSGSSIPPYPNGGDAIDVAGVPCPDAAGSP